MLFVTRFIFDLSFNSYSIRCSIRLVSFAFHFGSFNHSSNESINLRHFVLSNQNGLCLSITVHLLYISLPGSTVRLTHNFVFYCVLIVLPVKVAIDILINETTATAIL